ncbi:MAG: ATP-binding protein [Rhizobiales bacterium]|nr:ATP-binding protein [Hyphomicrobiales bacterium]
MNAHTQEGQNLPGYEGIDHISNNRSAWDHDDSASFLKYSLCQIELDRREAIAKRYDQEKQILQNSLPDVWKPLRDMAENLLPHLQFDKIDTTNRDQIRCLWRVHSAPASVDIDDLSSGEKSIVQLFYPLAENRIKKILRELKGEDAAQSPDPICILMDEPELHLHPNLQAKILDYIRNLSVRESAQFILATHSPTMVEYANSDELFLLRPAELVAEGQNQLIRIANDNERLQLLRDVFGSTSNITAMRPILVVEAKEGDKSSRRAMDARIYSFLSGEFSRITIVSGGGKSESAKVAKTLNEILQTFSSELRAHALLDRDVEESDPVDTAIHLLPVSMVENLLVDPIVIWQAATLVHHKMKLTSANDVATAIDEILAEMEVDEISRRIKARFAPLVFRLKDPVDGVEAQVDKFVADLKASFSPEKINQLRAGCEKKVSEIKDKNKRREFFHGKYLLDEFYKRHMHDTGMSKEIFIYDCARQASERSSVKVFVEQLLNSIGLKAVQGTKTNQG